MEKFKFYNLDKDQYLDSNASLKPNERLEIQQQSKYMTNKKN